MARGWSNRAHRIAGAAALIAGWGVLIYGLVFLTPSTDPNLDLEAGPAFAINVAVYLPGLALTGMILLTLVMLVGADWGHLSGLPVAVLAACFGWYVATVQALTAYLPGLEQYAWLSTCLCLVAVVTLLDETLAGIRRSRRSAPAQSG